MNQPLQPYVGPTVRMHSDAVVSSTGALLMKTVLNIIVNKWFTFASARFGCRIHVNQPLAIAVRSSVTARFERYKILKSKTPPELFLYISR